MKQPGKQRGKVLSFNDSLGHGFLECLKTGQKVWVHWTAIRSPGPITRKYLEVGEEVKFTEFSVSAQANRQASEVWVE